MEIVKYCHPVLRWKSKPIQEINDDLKRTVRQMFDKMYEARGIGLAANQVGLPYRFFVVNATADPAEVDEELVFINPKILKRKGSEEAEEGCLSLPQLYGDVPRAKEIVVEAFDLEGDCFELEVDDLLARVILHENDHLDGVLFIDRMEKFARKEKESMIEEFELVFRGEQRLGKYPSDEVLKQRLIEMEKSFSFPE